MFQFIGCFLLISKIRWQDVTLAGLPHSEIHESRLTCSSSWLIAAYRVLLRFETPRHPPYALLHLTYCSPSMLGDTAYPTVCCVRFVGVAYYACLIFLASGRIFGVDLTSAQNLNFHGFSRKSSSCDLRYFRFILICLGKSFSEENFMTWVHKVSLC